MGVSSTLENEPHFNLVVKRPNRSEIETEIDRIKSRSHSSVLRLGCGDSSPDMYVNNTKEKFQPSIPYISTIVSGMSGRLLLHATKNSIVILVARLSGASIRIIIFETGIALIHLHVVSFVSVVTSITLSLTRLVASSQSRASV